MNVRHLMLATTVAALTVLSVAACSDKSKDSSTTPSTGTIATQVATTESTAATKAAAPKSTNTPAPTATPAPPSNVAKIGDIQITVNAVAPYTSQNEFLAPKDGQTFWSVDITAENMGDSTYDLNPLNFKLVDSEKYQNTMAIADGPQPQVGAVTLAKGESSRGFITFSVKTGATPTGLHYQSFTGKTGTVGLPAASATS
jgi:hypothetical protein